MNGPHQQMDLWRGSGTSVLRIIGPKQKILLGLTKIQNTRKAAKPHDIGGGGGSKPVSGRSSIFQACRCASLDVSHHWTCRIDTEVPFPTIKSTQFPAATGDSDGEERGGWVRGSRSGSVSYSDSNVRFSQPMTINVNTMSIHR